MDLQELRRQIDGIDDNLLRLFQQRIELSVEIAKFKHQNDMPVHDPAREKQKMHDLIQKAKKSHEEYITALYTLLFELSRAEQQKLYSSAE